ncbi:hypothetical protein D9M69_520250 [compost metagenome]
MPGVPAESSLLSKIVQGSKFFRPRRRLERTTGSSVTVSPLGSSIFLGDLMAGSIEPMRTLRPAMWKMRTSCATLAR